MDDMTTTISTLKKAVAQFVNERDWEQFHSPKNLSMNIAVEASELMEKFLWADNDAIQKEFENERDEIEQELADVLIAVLAFSNTCNIDVCSALEKKLELTAQRYPIKKAKGKYTKYTKL